MTRTIWARAAKPLTLHLPGSFPSSQLASPALDSSIANTPSRPASPVNSPSFYFPSPPILQSPQPDSAALPAPPSPSTSIAPAVPSSTQHSIVISPPSVISSPSQPASPVISSSQPPAIIIPTSVTPAASPRAQSAPPVASSSSQSVAAATAIPTPVPTTPTVPPSPTQSAPIPATTSPVTAAPARTMASSAIGPGAMPAPRSNNAPYFSGQQGDSLADFLHEYDSLASSLGLTGGQKVDTILRYVPASTREFWMTLDSYSLKDWRDFRTDLENLYPDTTAGSRYTRVGLQEFVRISAQTRIQDEDDLMLYYRRFLQISNPLRLSHQLSEEQRNEEFFNGFHRKDRDVIYDRLFTINLRRPVNRAPDLEETWEAARGYFTNNQFHLHTARDALNNGPSNPDRRLMEQWFGRDTQDPHRPGQNAQRGYDQYNYDFYHKPALQSRYDDWQDNTIQPPVHTTKTVHSQDSGPTNNDDHLSNIIGKMHGLGTRDAQY